jgi:hypothetical protein
MALIVEDGSGVAGAVSYVEVAEADAYHLARGNGDWALASVADREAALVRGTMFVDGFRFVGVRAGRGQGLGWPREGAVDGDGLVIGDDEIPAEVREAVCEAALRELADPGVLSGDESAQGAVKRERVDVIETEYFEGGSAGGRLPVAAKLLAGLVRSGVSREVERS